jgi:predicted RNA-binding Zn-ribbon protein involved in translation (DUF1610 family)
VKRYNHLLGVGFSVTSSQQDLECVPVLHIINALQRRVDELRGLPQDEAREAFEDMRDTVEVEGEAYRCANCGTIHDEDEVVFAKDILQRLEPGDVFTLYECPDCGALAYPVKGV